VCKSSVRLFASVFVERLFALLFHEGEPVFVQVLTRWLPSPFSGSFFSTVAGDPLQTLLVDLSRGSDSVVFACMQWRSLFRAWRECTRLLLGNHRQADDADFGATLDRTRFGQHTAEDVAAINQTWYNYTDKERLRMPHLRALNVTADTYNLTMLENLPGPSFHFDAVDEVLARSVVDAANAQVAMGHAAAARITVRARAPIIAGRRFSPKIPTGTIGTVLEVPSSTECICELKGEPVHVMQDTWDVFNEDGGLTGRRTQLPIILAWAVTIHSAQGSELERVCIDFSSDRWACDGLVYTSLSRVHSFWGLRVRGLRAGHIKASAECSSLWKRLVESMDET